MLTTKAVGFECMIAWGDEPKPEFKYISFGDEVYNNWGDPIGDSYGVSDNNIFFYFDTEEIQTLQKLIQQGATEMWVDKEWMIDLTMPYEFRYLN